jgi:hypothetical protein
MTFRVNEQVSVLISLDGVELPFSVGNTLHALHIVGAGNLTLPALHIEFTDTLNVMAKRELNDAAQLEITIISNTSITRRFRVAKWTRAQAASGFSYAIDGYWDAPRYWMGTADRPIEGSSSSVLAEIAKASGLSVFGSNVATTDSQVWLPRNQTWGSFAHHISRHGYVNDRSYTALAVDTTGSLRYLDLNATPDPTLVLTHTPQTGSKFLLVSDFAPSAKSGLNTVIGGYRYDRVVQSWLKDTKTETNATVSSDSKKPALNYAAREIQKTGRVLYSPIDGGNTHTNYERALYQNTRFGLLFSVSAEFLTAAQTNLEFGDVFKYVSPASLGNATYDGKFTIATKIVFIVGSLYQEKFIAYKHGVQ